MGGKAYQHIRHALSSEVGGQLRRLYRIANEIKHRPLSQFSYQLPVSFLGRLRRELHTRPLEWQPVSKAPNGISQVTAGEPVIGSEGDSFVPSDLARAASPPVEIDL